MGQAVYADGRCFVFGGEVDSEKPANPAVGLNAAGTYTRVDIYTIASNTWSEGAAMPVGAHGISPVRLGNNVYLIGGGERRQGAWLRQRPPPSLHPPRGRSVSGERCCGVLAPVCSGQRAVR